MRPKTIVAIVLIAAGIAAFAYQGITYTTREKVLDMGSVHVMADKTRTFPLPPIVGAVTIICGILLLVIGGKND